MQIFIKQELADKDCKTIDLDVSAYELIKNIKLRIEEREGILDGS